MELLKIKPLTEEEKKQKLVELQDKMAEKRALKAAEEAKEAKANELIRRKAGKVSPIHHQANQSLLTHTYRQETAQVKEDLKNKQLLKDLEEKRRGSSHFPLSSPSLLLSHRQVT